MASFFLLDKLFMLCYNLFSYEGDVMILLDGKSLRNKKLDILKEKISNLEKKLTLVVIQVGSDDASDVYVNQKKKMAEYVGYNFIHKRLDDSISEDDLLEVIESYNNDKAVDGILVQMPLPKHINEVVIQNKILYYKDVDGLSDINMGRLVHNRKSLVACTAKGIVSLLKEYNIDLVGKNVVIVGRSNLVGKPLFNLLLNMDATVTIVHSKTNNLDSITKMADILVVAVGKKEFINKSMIKKNAVVIDVGINKMDGKLYGDVDFDNVKDVVSYITPVPGGVGPMTVTELGYNVLDAYYMGCDIFE